MRRVLIDTNIYAAFKRNNKAIVEQMKKFDYIGLNATVLAELYSGFKGGQRELHNNNELIEFINTPRVNLLTIDKTTAEFYAEIYHKLKKKGTPIPTNDIWIAASAMENGLGLFTLDTHFNKIDGLIIV